MIRIFDLVYMLELFGDKLLQNRTTYNQHSLSDSISSNLYLKKWAKAVSSSLGPIVNWLESDCEKEGHL